MGALSCAVGAGGVLTCAFFTLVAGARLSDYLRQKPERPVRESLVDTALLLPRVLRRGWRVTPLLALVAMIIFVASCVGIYRWVQVTPPQPADDFREAGSDYLVAALTLVSLCFGYLLGGLQKEISARASTSRVVRAAPWVVVVFLSGTLWSLNRQAFGVDPKHSLHLEYFIWVLLCLPLWLSLIPLSSHDPGAANYVEQHVHDGGQLLVGTAARAPEQVPGQMIARVRALHANHDGVCAHCHLPAPCPTIRALDGN